MIQITDAIAIEEREVEESFVRAAGPGGQNVNKVATAVQLCPGSRWVGTFGGAGGRQALDLTWTWRAPRVRRASKHRHTSMAR